jgi:3-dehydroquinate synthase
VIRIDAPYPVWVGAGLMAEAQSLLPPGRFFLVSDRNVEAAGWLRRVEVALAPRVVGTYVLPPGEENKNFSRLEKLLEVMLEARVERSDHLVAIGGGMVGDLAGLSAALLKRGCGFVQVPTSLLAQADAAIGGKTAVNTRQGKNLIGAFHAPATVIADIDTLATLPRDELCAGYAEVVKYGLIGDARFFDWCEAHADALLAGDERALLHAVETSLRAKIRHVVGDERDLSGQRALLNFGHSFGHAIETETGMRHGEAVALGMVLAFRLSAQRGHCPQADAERVATHLARVGLPTRLEGIAPARLAERMGHDKKRESGRLRLVLARRIGEAFLDASVSGPELEAFLEREAESARIAVG